MPVSLILGYIYWLLELTHVDFKKEKSPPCTIACPAFHAPSGTLEGDPYCKMSYRRACTERLVTNIVIKPLNRKSFDLGNVQM